MCIPISSQSVPQCLFVIACENPGWRGWCLVKSLWGFHPSLVKSPHIHLVGGSALPLWKNMSSSVGMMTFPTECINKMHVPKHQPVMVQSTCFSRWIPLFGVEIPKNARPPGPGPPPSSGSPPWCQTSWSRPTHSPTENRRSLCWCLCFIGLKGKITGKPHIFSIFPSTNPMNVVEMVSAHGFL